MHFVAFFVHKCLHISGLVYIFVRLKTCKRVKGIKHIII